MYTCVFIRTDAGRERDRARERERERDTHTNAAWLIRCYDGKIRSLCLRRTKPGPQQSKSPRGRRDELRPVEGAPRLGFLEGCSWGFGFAVFGSGFGF